MALNTVAPSSPGVSSDHNASPVTGVQSSLAISDSEEGDYDPQSIVTVHADSTAPDFEEDD